MTRSSIAAGEERIGQIGLIAGPAEAEHSDGEKSCAVAVDGILLGGPLASDAHPL